MRSILCFGLGLLLTSMALHIVIWRWFPIRNQPSRLVLIFIALPALIVAACLTVLSSWSVIPKWPWAMWCLGISAGLFPVGRLHMCFYRHNGFQPVHCHPGTRRAEYASWITPQRVGAPLVLPREADWGPTRQSGSPGLDFRHCWHSSASTPRALRRPMFPDFPPFPGTSRHGRGLRK